MVAPNLKESTSTLVDSGNPPTRFDGPALNHLVKVIKGTHATDKIQIQNVEPLERFSQYFDWLIRSIGTPLQPDYAIQVINLKTGVIELTTTELRFATLHVSNAVPHTSAPPAESFPVIRIALQGILDCKTRANFVNRSCVIDGLGTAVVRRAADYHTDAALLFQILNSNVIMKNFRCEDLIMGATTITDQGNTSNAIVCEPAAPGVENVILENIVMKDFVQHAVSFTRPPPVYIKNIRFTNLTYDTTHAAPSAEQTHGGSLCTIRSGVTHAYLENNRHIDSGHSSQDVNGTNPHVVFIGNYHSKNTGSGGGIALCSVAERAEDWGEVEENPIRDNYFFSTYYDIVETEAEGGITQSTVRVHGDSRKNVIENNFIEGAGEHALTVQPFNVTRGENSPFLAYSDEVIITNNIMRKLYRQGIWLDLNPLTEAVDPMVITKPCNSVSVIGNEIEPIKGPSGIFGNNHVKFCLFCNNQIYNVNSRNQDDGCGIGLRINSPDCVIMGNHILQPSAGLANLDHNVYQQSQGSVSPTNRTLVLDNDLQPDKPVTLVGSDNIVNGNVGYKTEAWGTATVATGATVSSAISHTLNYTPTAKDIIIRPAGAVGSATQYYPTSIGASTFTITVNAAPGAGVTASFAWRIKRNG